MIASLHNLEMKMRALFFFFFFFFPQVSMTTDSDLQGTCISCRMRKDYTIMA